jgi:Xaa-Pro aminopeptidase
VAGVAVTTRIEWLRERLSDLEVVAFLVTNGTNVRYLTGFASSNAWLVVDAQRTALLTDGRYIEAARAVPDVEPLVAERNLPTTLRERLSELTDGPVAFESEHMSVAVHERVAESGVELVGTRKVVEELRAIKDDAELAAIRRSSALLSEVFERFSAERVVGRTEGELAWWVERTIRELGAEATSFAPIVASGPNAALPHHHPGARVVQADEILLLDAGALVDGYCSDCTRTFATGALAPELERAYTVCLEAQERSLAAVASGAVCREVDEIGHSLGLEIHEDPRLAKESESTLAAGNVVTVEPGVYLPGAGGVRIEDLVIVGDQGHEVLTTFTKELVSLEA